MPSILIRNVDVRTVSRLKQQAKRNGRSLQSEVMRIINQESPQADIESVWDRIAGFRKRFRGRKFSDSVELIREDRDR